MMSLNHFMDNLRPTPNSHALASLLDPHMPPVRSLTQLSVHEVPHTDLATRYSTRPSDPPSETSVPGALATPTSALTHHHLASGSPAGAEAHTTPTAPQPAGPSVPLVEVRGLPSSWLVSNHQPPPSIAPPPPPSSPSTITRTLARNMRRHNLPSGPLPVRYTPVTGRVSKAQKGMPVHTCMKCNPPRTFSRAEHLRRHSLSHGTPEFRCPHASCPKAFYRQDLLDRHMNSHTSTAESSSKSASSTTTKVKQLASLSSTPIAIAPLPSLVDTRPRNLTATRSAPANPLIPADPPRPSSSPRISPPESSSFSSESSLTLGLLRPGEGRPPSILTTASAPASLVKFGPSAELLPLPDSAPQLVDSISPTTDVSAGPSHSSYHYNHLPSLAEAKRLGMRESHLTLSKMPSRPVPARDVVLRCIKENFWPSYHKTFPIIHRPTYEAGPEPILEYAIAAIAMMRSGESQERVWSMNLHERATEKLRSLPESELRNPQIMQAVVLCESFSRFCGRIPSTGPSHAFEYVYAYVFFESPDESRQPSLSDRRLLSDTDQWCAWVLQESYRRLRTACFIVDTQISLYLQQPRAQAFHRVKYTITAKTPLAFTTRTKHLWSASTADEWMGLVQSDQTRLEPEYLPDIDTLTDQEVYSHHSLDRSAMLSLALTRLSCLPRQPPRYAAPTPPAGHHSAHMTCPSSCIPLLVEKDDFAEQRVVRLFQSCPMANAQLAIYYTPLLDLLSLAGKSWVYGLKQLPANSIAASQQRVQLWARHTPHHCHELAGMSIVRATHYAAQALLSYHARESWSSEASDYWAMYVCALICWAFGCGPSLTHWCTPGGGATDGETGAPSSSRGLQVPGGMPPQLADDQPDLAANHSLLPRTDEGGLPDPQPVHAHMYATMRHVPAPSAWPVEGSRSVYPTISFTATDHERSKNDNAALDWLSELSVSRTMETVQQDRDALRLEDKAHAVLRLVLRKFHAVHIDEHGYLCIEALKNVKKLIEDTRPWNGNDGSRGYP